MSRCLEADTKPRDIESDRFASGTIVYLDSLHGINRNLLKTILNYVKLQHVSYSTSMFEEKDWDIGALTDLNLQKNSMIVECMLACTVLQHAMVASLIATVWIQNHYEIGL